MKSRVDSQLSPTAIHKPMPPYLIAQVCPVPPSPGKPVQDEPLGQGQSTFPLDAPVVAWTRVCVHSPRPRGGRVHGSLRESKWPDEVRDP